MKPSCKNCKFYDNSLDIIFGCRRYPERIQVQPTDWCGEFKSKAEKTEKSATPKVSKEDMDAVVRAYRTAFQARFNATPSVSKVDYAAAKKMILDDGVESSIKYINSFFWFMPQWNLENKVFDLRVIPGLRNKLMLTPTANGEQSVQQFLDSCSDGERHSRLWNEYSDYVKKTGKKIPMKEWLTVNG